MTAQTGGLQIQPVRGGKNLVNAAVGRSRLPATDRAAGSGPGRQRDAVGSVGIGFINPRILPGITGQPGSEQRIGGASRGGKNRGKADAQQSSNERWHFHKKTGCFGGCVLLRIVNTGAVKRLCARSRKIVKRL